MANVVAVKLGDASGSLIESGQLCFLGTDASNVPINYQRGGGGATVKDPACIGIVNGAIVVPATWPTFPNWQVANPAHTVPPIDYRITIHNDKTGQDLTYTKVSFDGATFNLDNYGPTAPGALPPNGGSVAGTLSVNGDLTITGSCTGCGTGGGGGLTLNSQTGSTQTFANDTNVTIVSASNTHTITWVGALAKARQHAMTSYFDAAQTWTASQRFSLGAVHGLAVGGLDSYTELWLPATSPLRSAAVTSDGGTFAAVFGLDSTASNNGTNDTAAIAASNNLSNTNGTQDNIAFEGFSFKSGNAINLGSIVGVYGSPEIRNGSMAKAIGVWGEVYLSGTGTTPFSTAFYASDLNYSGSGTHPAQNIAYFSEDMVGAATTDGNYSWLGGKGQSDFFDRVSIFMWQDAKDALKITRATDSSPTGNFLNLRNHADNTSLFQVDVAGVVQAGTVPGARVSGNISGNAGTATALAANGSNCSAGNAAAGVDASGVAEGCAALPANTTATASNWFTAYNSTTGAFTKAQPNFTDLAGSVAAAQMPALTGDVTSSAGSTATTLANIPTGTPAVGTILRTNIAAPSSPAAGKVSTYSDSTDLRFHDKNASGVIGTTVVADTGASNNFLTAVSAAGVISKAQPSFSTLSGSVAAGQMPALTGAVVTSAGAVATTAGVRDLLDASAFCSDAGANDTYACSLSPAIGSYVTGTHYRFKANTANTGAATINLNSLGAKTIKKAAGGITTDLADNDIRAGQWVDLVYDGTNMEMQSTLGNAASGSGTTVTVTGSGLAGTTGNLSNTTPAIPSGQSGAKLVQWQADSGSPTTNISGYINGLMPRMGNRRWQLNSGDCGNSILRNSGIAPGVSLSTQTASCGDATNGPYQIFTTAASSGVDTGFYDGGSNWSRWGRNNLWQSYVNTDATTSRRIIAGMVDSTSIGNWLGSDTPNTIRIAAFQQSATLGVPGDWYCFLANAAGGAAHTQVDTGQSVSAGAPGTLHQLEIREDSNGFRFYIDGTEVCAGMSQTNKPTGTTNGVGSAVTLRTTAATAMVLRAGFQYMEADK